MLLGAAQSLLEQMGASLKPFERRLHDSTREQAAALCGHAAFGALTEQGAAMALPEAVELARGAADAQTDLA